MGGLKPHGELSGSDEDTAILTVTPRDPAYLTGHEPDAGI
jgi:hypothetical protein